MKTLGLLGGVASGKSTVADLFRQRGAAVLDADRTGHEVLRMPAIRAAVSRRIAVWDIAVLRSDAASLRAKRVCSTEPCRVIVRIRPLH